MTKRTPDHPNENAPANDRKKSRKRPGRDGDRPAGDSRTRGPQGRPDTDAFICVNCHASIGPTVSGGRHRNHCPRCLYSRHVDDARPGDRANACRGAMAPIGRFERANGEPVVLHRCLRCGFERHNRVAADDNWARYQALPQVESRVGTVTGQTP